MALQSKLYAGFIFHGADLLNLFNYQSLQNSLRQKLSTIEEPLTAFRPSLLARENIARVDISLDLC